MVRVLLIGGGGREHAVADALARSPDTEIYTLMSRKNPGIASLSSGIKIASESDVDAVREYALQCGAEYAVVGPEAPLAAGVVDVLEEAGVPTLGPRALPARIETDKAWARAFMSDAGIAGCPPHVICKTPRDIRAAVEKLEDVVVKPAGLTGGKGVKVMGEHLASAEQVREYAVSLLPEHGAVVIEKRLVGEEFTVQAFSDGNTLSFSPPVQDHKRAYEGDVGPNTGGMGSYSDADHLLPFLEHSEYVQACVIMEHTIEAMREVLGEPYVGILYGQFILTAQGVFVVEYNARFGDPEAMNILPLLQTPFTDVLRACVEGNLSQLDVVFERMATVCKYVVPEGYPKDPMSDLPIDARDVGDAQLFYSSVYEKDGVVYTTSSRAAAVVGLAPTIEQAEAIAEDAVLKIKGELHHRRDIGTPELIQRRIEHMRKLRGTSSKA